MPEKNCTDKKCPFHGQIAVKSELFTGKVIKKDISRSATIEWSRSRHVPKYERYEVRRSRMRVHNPACVDAQIGQKVIVGRTRPLSKDKHHVILTVVDEKSELKKETQSSKTASASTTSADNKKIESNENETIKQ